LSILQLKPDRNLSIVQACQDDRFWANNQFQEYSKKPGLSVLKESALAVAGARLGLASEAYGASRKTFPNPPAP